MRQAVGRRVGPRPTLEPLWLEGNGAVKALQALARDAGVRQRAPVRADVAVSLKERQVSLRPHACDERRPTAAA